MFIKVKNQEEQRAFEEIWDEVCAEQQYVADPYHSSGIRYLIKDEKYGYVGTIEYIPYDPSIFTTVEDKFRFSEIEDVKKLKDQTFEIDKLCIKKEYRRKGYMKNILLVFRDHINEYNAKQYIAIMESAFYRSFKQNYGITVKKVGNQIRRPKSIMLPIIFDASTINDDIVKSVEAMQYK